MRPFSCKNIFGRFFEYFHFFNCLAQMINFFKYLFWKEFYTMLASKNLTWKIFFQGFLKISFGLYYTL